NTGNAHSSLGQHAKAIEYLERALQLRVAMSDRQGEAITLNHLGRALRLSGEAEKAEEIYGQALPISRAGGDSTGEVAPLYGMARVESERGDLLGASQRTESALAIINTLRTKVT